MTFVRKLKRAMAYLAGVLLLAIIGLFVAAWLTPIESMSRVQVSSGLNLSGLPKAAVTEYYQDHGRFPADNVEAGLPPPSEIADRFVSGIQVTAGEVVVTFSDEANEDVRGKTLIMRPKGSDERVSWVCFSRNLQQRALPAACRSE